MHKWDCHGQIQKNPHQNRKNHLSYINYSKMFKATAPPPLRGIARAGFLQEGGNPPPQNDPATQNDSTFRVCPSVPLTTGPSRFFCDVVSWSHMIVHLLLACRCRTCKHHTQPHHFPLQMQQRADNFEAGAVEDGRTSASPFAFMLAMPRFVRLDVCYMFLAIPLGGEGSVTFGHFGHFPLWVRGTFASQWAHCKEGNFV